VVIKNQIKFLSLSVTKNLNEINEPENFTIVINDFTERKNLEEQTKRQEKLSAMGELASGVAHEIRNPINAIGMIAQRLNKEFIPNKDSDEYESILNVLKDEVTRINKIITQFLNYAKPLGIELKTIEANEYFDDIYRLYIDQSNLKKIHFNKLSTESIRIKIDPELMKQALMNIVQNAIDAAGENGSVTINYYKTGELLNIVIEDDGVGIAEDQLKRIFDLYFTTKKEGNGLGLSIAQKIVNQHNGTIIVESKIKKGTKFIIKIPTV
jgi:signal transduction histidine kinase